MGEVHRYNFPTTIHAGPGARRGLPEALKAAGVARALIVTDEGLADLEPIRDIRGLLADAGLDAGLFAGIVGNPLVSHVTAGVAAFRDGGHDGIVAVGGGAALDVSKCVALMVHHPGELLDYEDGKPDARPVDQPIPLIAAVPTTAGTGSEVGRAAVVSLDDTHVKKIIFDPRLLPPVVFADAELTLSLPPEITAATGMDALSHLTEAYVAKGHHPMCDGIALSGIQIVAQDLARCVGFAREKTGATEEHVAARQAMLEAATMGAVAFQKGLGVTHSCAHALSAVCDLHHGLANGVLLPTCMAFNLAAVPQRFAQMANIAGLEAPTGDGFIEWLRQLQRDTGTPATLGEVGVANNQIETLVDIAIDDPCHQSNPRPVGRDDLHAIFAQAIKGA